MQADYGFAKKKLSIYIFGFSLCVLLTLTAFGAVIYPTFSKAATLGIIFTAALAQFLVQVICFLRLATETEQGVNNILSFIFTLVILITIISCSCWIMWSLNYHMMS